MPFLLLPFRPGSDPVGSKSFIRNYFRLQYEGSWRDNRAFFEQELRLMDPLVRLDPTLEKTNNGLHMLTGACQYHEVVLEQTSRWCRDLGDL